MQILDYPPLSDASFLTRGKRKKWDAGEKEEVESREKGRVVERRMLEEVEEGRSEEGKTEGGKKIARTRVV